MAAPAPVGASLAPSAPMEGSPTEAGKRRAKGARAGSGVSVGNTVRWLQNLVLLAWLAVSSVLSDVVRLPARLLRFGSRAARPKTPEPISEDVLEALEKLKEELQGPSREKVDRLARSLAEQRTLSSNRLAASAAIDGGVSSGIHAAPVTPPKRNNSASALAHSAGGFFRRTFSFGRIPPVPPSPPLPATPSRAATLVWGIRKWFSRTFPDVHWALTAYRSPELELPKSNERREIKAAILRAPQVVAAIKTSAEVNGITIEQATRNADHIFETMAANFWLPMVRFIGYFLRKTLRLLYPFGMDVGTSDLQRVRDVARKGPIIYLPSHKSYMDFLVVSYICFRHGLPMPHVVSGENLNIPLVGPILRYGGAFFIRRTFNSGADPLFRSVFNEYVTQLLMRGRAVECFIEGGRSRTGKVLPPKPGFLRCVIDAVVDRQVGDVYLVPMSLGYDRIVENDSYIKELTGGKKNAERLFAFLASTTSLLLNTITTRRNFGKINVGIGEPISLHEYLLRNLSSLPDGLVTTEFLASVPSASASLAKPLADPAAATAEDAPIQEGAATPAPAPRSAANGTVDGADTDVSTDAGSTSPETGHEDDGQSTGGEPAAQDSDSDDGGISLRAGRDKIPVKATANGARIGSPSLGSPRGTGIAVTSASSSSGAGTAVGSDERPRTSEALTLRTQLLQRNSGLATTPSPRTPLQFLSHQRHASSHEVTVATMGGRTSVEAAAATAMSCPLPPSSTFTPSLRKYMTVTVGYKVMYEVNHVSTVLPATLVGTILFTQYGRGIRDSDLVNKVRWLRRQVILRGGRVQMVPEEALHESIMATVDKVLAGSVKGKLVKRHKDILMLSVYSPAERMELSLYRNQLIHLFVSDGILLCSFYACELESSSNPAWVDKEELRSSVQFLSQMLKLEFVFKPSPGIDVILDQTIRSLMDQGIVMRDDSDTTRERYCVNDQLGADGQYQGTYTYLFICSLFWPFIDSYLLAALSCYRLLPDRMLDEESLIRWIQTLGETLYFEGLLDLYEAISKDTLQNGLTLLENWGVIHYVSVESDWQSATTRANRKIVQLTAAYREEAAVEKMVLKIMSYRKRLRAYRSRRYKSRRDNQNIDVINLVKRSDMNPVKTTV